MSDTEHLGKLVILRCSHGTLSQGFSVTLQIGDDGAVPQTQLTGSLPPAPQLGACYRQWQSLYTRLGETWRLEPRPDPLQTGNWQTDQAQLLQACQVAAQTLYQTFNQWLAADAFRPLRDKLLEQLSPQEPIRIILQTDDRQIQKLPWHQWEWVKRYPQAEIALATPIYEGSLRPTSPASGVNILAIFGTSHGIDTTVDRALLADLPQAHMEVLVEPTRQALQDLLWEQSWDIVFFAGHSFSRDDESTGYLCLNPQETLPIEELRYALKAAVNRGVQLAIFNSCDGLGIGHALADLHIPQLVVMREPIPDPVAQVFLQYFLRAFAQGQALYVSVRQARERLQSMESGFPAATWLPVIFQNPAVVPPTWQQLCAPTEAQITPSPAVVPQAPTPGVASERRCWWSHPGLQVLGSSALLAAAVITMRWFGVLQSMELVAFDQFLHWRPLEGADSRFLVVTIAETDLKAQANGSVQQGVTDETLNQLLDRLEASQPRVIGLDLYRDFPVSQQQPQLAKRLSQSQALVGVCKSRDSQVDPAGVAPPPELPIEQVGFSDFLADDDGILRRQLLYLTPEPAASCQTPFAFGTLLAFLYLESTGIRPEFTSTNDLVLGETVIRPLRAHGGGYHGIDAHGLQVLLNYRALRRPEQIAPQVTLTQVLTGRVEQDRIQDKIVIIGGIVNASGDQWATPYGASHAHQVPGVYLQTHMASQLISAVADQRPLLWVWPLWGDGLWIWGWAVVGGLLGWRLRFSRAWGMSCVMGVGALTGACLVILVQEGGWLPLVPAFLAFQATGVQMVYQQAMLKRP